LQVLHFVLLFHGSTLTKSEKKKKRKEKKKLITPLQLPPLNDIVTRPGFFSQPVLIFSDHWISLGPKTRSFLSFSTLLYHLKLVSCIPEGSTLRICWFTTCQSNLKFWGLSPPFLVCL
ncbi:hypothetical protein N7497_003199, partial [Penicillium chrysogenum]